MMSRQTALIFLIIGVVMVPGPAYAITLEQLDSPEQTRSPTGYVAPELNVSNDMLLVEQYGHSVSFDVQDLQYRHVADDYAAPNKTRDVLNDAIRNGSAETTNSTVERDLRRIANRSSLLTDNRDSYYRFEISIQQDTVVVTTRNATASDVARSVREEQVVTYDSLSTNEQTTFDKIRNATRNSNGSAYRPLADESVPDPSTIVFKDGTHYGIVAQVHVDDFGFPDGLVLGLAGSVVGLLSLLVAGSLYFSGAPIRRD